MTDLIKVFTFTGLSTLVKMLTSYVTVKVVASVVGPSGIALVGQLQNFVNVFTTLGSGGINNGVVKYVAEKKEHPSQLAKFLQNALKLTLYFSLICGVILIGLSTPLSNLILLDEGYNDIFIWFGVSLIFLSLNNFFLSILNGFKEFRKYVIVSIVTSLLGLIFTLFIVLRYELKGALLSTVIFQSLGFFVSLFLVSKQSWFSRKVLWGRLDRKVVRRYLAFSMMALVTATTVPVSQLLVRSYIIENYSVTAAGYWEGINRVSGLLLVFVTTSFSVYYLPRLSEIRDDGLLRREIVQTFKILAPLVFMVLVLIFLLKSTVIEFLFTKEFYAMQELFLWQLTGDFFKIMSWVLAFVMIARSMTKIFIITEVLSSVVFVFFSFLLIRKSDIIGATEAYCLTYILYFLMMIFIFRKLLFKRKITT